MPKRAVVFGGAFNPPTKAHEAIVAACLALPDVDEVWLMPSGDRLDKTIGCSDQDRLAMLRLLQERVFGSDPRLRVSDFELRLQRPTKTYETVRALRRAHPNTAFSFVFGRDSYLTMPGWPQGKQLRTDLQMLIFTSGPGEQISAPNVTMLDIPEAYGAVSSTAARTAAAGNRSLTDIVDPAIATYIKEYQLYRILK
jgi:nicotinate-nucleotide adenylyltransferase